MVHAALTGSRRHCTFKSQEGGNGAVVWYSVQVSRAISVVISERDLVGDGRHPKINRGIPSSRSKKYCRDDGASYNERGVRVEPGGCSSVDRWDMENQGIYLAEAGPLIGTGRLPAHI